jgi:hypothetical protein
MKVDPSATAESLASLMPMAEKQFEARQRGLDRSALYGAKKSDRAAADEQKKTDKYDKEFADFSKVVSNPTTRSAIGAAQAKIVAAQAVEAMLSKYKKPDGSDSFDEVTPQQAEEVVRAMDRMISGAAPTMSGQEHLRPTSIMSKIQETMQQVTNQPQGAKLGAFMRNFEDTIKREQQMATMQKKGYMKGLAAGHKHLVEADPQRFNDIVEAATNDEALPFTAKIEGGQPQAPAKQDDHDGAAQWLADPKNQADPRYASVKAKYEQAHGAGRL